MTGNAVSEGSSRAGNSAHSPSSRAQARDLTQADGSHKAACTTIVRSRGPSPQKGSSGRHRVVLGNGDRVLAFALSSRAPRGTSPKLVDHTGWLTQDRLLDVWPISRSDYLCMSLQNRSVCGRKFDRGDVAAACDHRRL